MSERPTVTLERRVTGRTDALCTGSSDAYAENWPTASNGSLDMVAYIYMCSPGHLKFAGVAGHPTHTQEHLQAIPEHIKSLVLSTSFASVSARLALE